MALPNISKVYAGTDEVSKMYLAGEIVYQAEEPTPPAPVPYNEQYFTIEALSAGTLSVSSEGVYYSLNGGTWTHPTISTPISLSQGDKVRFKGNVNHDLTGLFSGNTMSFNVYGNIESLEYGDDFSGQTSIKVNSGFSWCFWNCTGLTDASNLILPATALTSSCYYRMFMGCTSLATAPALPATTLGSTCYYGMFMGCTSLATAPALPATALTYDCYDEMFNRCTSLTTAPALPATTLANSCYTSMFKGCTSLTTAPVLPAQTLVNQCYRAMFSGCTSLDYVECYATSISALSATTNWMNSVAATGTFKRDPSMADWTTGVDGIPSGWTVLEPPQHTTGVWLKDISDLVSPGEFSGTPCGDTYVWEFDPAIETREVAIVVDGEYVNLSEVSVCGYEYYCSGITDSAGGWDDVNDEWIECAYHTGTTVVEFNINLNSATYTPSASTLNLEVDMEEECTCEDQGLCDDGEGGCTECGVDCGHDWENLGYESYEDCTCQNYGENCEEPDCESQGLCDDGEGNCIECEELTNCSEEWENLGYSSEEECDCQENNMGCEAEP